MGGFGRLVLAVAIFLPILLGAAGHDPSLGVSSLGENVVEPVLQQEEKADVSELPSGVESVQEQTPVAISTDNINQSSQSKGESETDTAEDSEDGEGNEESLREVVVEGIESRDQDVREEDTVDQGETKDQEELEALQKVVDDKVESSDLGAQAASQKNIADDDVEGEDLKSTEIPFSNLPKFEERPEEKHGNEEAKTDHKQDEQHDLSIEGDDTVTEATTVEPDKLEQDVPHSPITNEVPSMNTPSDSVLETVKIEDTSSEFESSDALKEREHEIVQQVTASSSETDDQTESPQIVASEPFSPSAEEENQPHHDAHDEKTFDSEHEVHDDDHEHDHHHHHHHHHRHSHDFFKETNETSSVILVIKHLSSTLLSFLPEPLQDTILDVDDALVFTGIIALTLVSICVPYFLIEGYMSVRPLKKKVVELNKSLWKVSAAYETQQEEFEIFKQKAIAHDEFKKRAEQSENDVVILKKLETKHREQITALKTQLKSQMKEAVDIRALIEKTLEAKKTVSEECEKYKAAYENAKESLTKFREESTNFQTHAKSTALQLGVSNKNAEMLASKITMLEQEMEEIKSQLVAESEKRKLVEKERQEVEQSKVDVEKELSQIKNICHQYEDTVGGLNEEIGKLESELATIRESLGEDSPLLEVAEIQAKAAYSEKEADSLRTRLEGLTADNENLTVKLKETTAALDEARGEGEHTNNRLQVLEKYFKEREEEYMKTIEQLQLKESVRDKGKEELIRIIEEKENVCKDLNERLETLKEEFEETKKQHRNEIRSLEAKSHENWLSLCQAERKAQDARKEAEGLRQLLTQSSKEKDDKDGDGLNLNGDVLFPVIPHELVPLPILDEPPSYFGLGDFVPPPPLPEGEEREPDRPPPLGSRLSPSFSDMDDNILSPIGVGRREEECTDGSSGSNSPRRSPPLRGGWVNVQNDRAGQGRESMRRLSRATSSPIQPGANL